MEQADFLLGDVPESIVALYRRASTRYRFRPLDCRAIFIQCQDGPTARVGQFARTTWEKLFVRGVETLEMPSAHFSLLKDPHIHLLAKRISDRLEGFYRAAA